MRRGLTGAEIQMSALEALIPPDELIREHSGGIDRATYVTMGDEIVKHSLIDGAGLRPDGRFLDVGCGCAKLARPLTQYLSSKGSYRGIDIVEECIAWCRQAYHEYPQFRFDLVDLFSTRYNPDGRHHAATYRFPVPSDSIDVAFLGSVFTHLLPNEVENYLDEIARVLRPGGTVLATYFVLDDEARANVESGRSSPPLPFLLPGGSGCRVGDLKVPEAAIAYEEGFLRQAYGRAGLTVTGISYARWARGEIVPHWQDEVWARKPTKPSRLHRLKAEFRRTRRQLRLLDRRDA